MNFNAIDAIKKVRLLCWQGYDHPTIVSPFSDNHSVDLDVQCLLSDALVANQLVNGDAVNWDCLNINNAYIRDFLYPKKLIQKLDVEQYPEYLQGIHDWYSDLIPWSFAQNGELIGIGQRFGPFNFVVNTQAISKQTAEQQGFDLANDPLNKNRFGILDYPDFNVFHFCIGSGLDPFQQLGSEEFGRFRATATQWFKNAAFISDDHLFLNQKLIQGEIDFYISGGVYTASAARAQGYDNIVSITPREGPINGKGGIVFSEITSLIRNDHIQPESESFLHYLLQPETAKNIAFVDGTCNPVAQMGDPRVFKLFSSQELNIIQWHDLQEDLSYCAHYQIPPNNQALITILNQVKSNKINFVR